MKAQILTEQASHETEQALTDGLPLLRGEVLGLIKDSPTVIFVRF